MINNHSPDEIRPTVHGARGDVFFRRLPQDHDIQRVIRRMNAYARLCQCHGDLAETEPAVDAAMARRFGHLDGSRLFYVRYEALFWLQKGLVEHADLVRCQTAGRA